MFHVQIQKINYHCLKQKLCNGILGIHHFTMVPPKLFQRNPIPLKWLKHLEVVKFLLMVEILDLMNNLLLRQVFQMRYL